VKIASDKKKNLRVNRKYLSNLFITHEFFPKKGGIAICTEELARASCKLNYKTEVWVPKNKILRKFSKDCPFKIKELSIKGTHGLICITKLIFYLIFNQKRIKDKCIILTEPGPIISTMIMNYFSLINFKKLVIFLHGSEILKFSRSFILKYLFLKFLKKINLIVYHSKFNYYQLIKLIDSRRYKISKKKLCMIPGAIRSNLLNLKDQNDRKINNIKKNKIDILTVGRIHPRKGQLNVVESLLMLSNKIRNKIRYNIVGSIIDPKYFKKIKRASNKTDVKINFFSSVSDKQLINFYKKSDLFILTSIPYKKSIEGFGLVYLEAGFFSVPSIGYDVGGVKNAIIHNKTGILIKDRKKKSLSSAIKLLINNHRLRKKLGIGARNYSNSVSWEKNMKNIMKKIEN
jgi:phosphatidylinositol alpha-1,6-mannosyltransferase